MSKHLGFGPLRPGMRVGLLGGSFDPPHEGHHQVAREALRRFGLDRVILLVSPGNPLKNSPHADLRTRVAATRAMITHPRILVSDVEARLGTRYTAETLAALQARLPGVDLVWLMGADNLAGFHRWDRWADIMRRVPLGVLARPGHRIPARFSPAARRFNAARLSEHAAPLLPRLEPPVWCFVTMPLVPVSSSELRKEGHWGVGELPTAK